MKPFLSLFVIATFLLTPCYSVLPPLYNSIEEIHTLLNDPDIQEHLSTADVILSIERTQDGWIIKGNKNTATAKVVPLPQKMPGPTKYKVIWQD